MFISVVVPNLNSPIIHRTIESLEAQSLSDERFEIIVVGTDQLNLVVESSLTKFDQSEEPLFPGAARNRGVAQARGDLIAFIDADCIADRDWLQNLSAPFKTPSISVIGGGVKFEADSIWSTALNLSGFHDYLSTLSRGTRSQLPSINLMLRREIFDKVKGFDEQRFIGEDSDLTIRLKNEGHSLHFEPNAYVTHHSHRNQYRDLLRYEFLRGKHSIRFDPNHKKEYGFPPIVGSRIGLLISAPFLALGITARIFFHKPNMRQYWHAFPAVLLAKLVWCVGASAHV
jgi:glycosyltransferase involved in cell wall biosynthesis